MPGDATTTSTTPQETSVNAGSGDGGSGSGGDGGSSSGGDGGCCVFLFLYRKQTCFIGGQLCFVKLIKKTCLNNATNQPILLYIACNEIITTSLIPTTYVIN